MMRGADPRQMPTEEGIQKIENLMDKGTRKKVIRIMGLQIIMGEIRATKERVTKIKVRLSLRERRKILDIKMEEMSRSKKAGIVAREGAIEDKEGIIQEEDTEGIPGEIGEVGEIGEIMANLRTTSESQLQSDLIPAQKHSRITS